MGTDHRGQRMQRPDDELVGVDTAAQFFDLARDVAPRSTELGLRMANGECNACPFRSFPL